MTFDLKLTPLVIRASAGTGKTFRLSNRYLGLILHGARIDHVLATTFTRKAAREILDRVLVRLAEAAKDDARCRELAANLTTPDLDRDRCRQMLETTLRQLHRLQVSTLDSFFSRVARSFTLELGLPPGWGIIEQVDDDRLRREAIQQVLAEDNPQELLTLLHLLTKGETSRSVAGLVRDIVNSLYELYLETDSAAWERVPRPRTLSAAELAETIDALRQTPLSNQRMEDARDSDLAQAMEEAWEVFLQKGLAAKVLDGSCVYYKKEISAPAVELYRRLLEHARGVLVGRVANQTEGTFDLLSRFDVHYQRLKQLSRGLRFADVTRSLAGVSGLGGVGRLAFRLDASIEHLLLDEFQDTSLFQWQVIRPFAEQVTQEPTRSFFCVGDIKQAIYGWRGGVAEIFDALPEQLRGLVFQSLNESRRSSQPVIDVVNRVFTNIASHPHLERTEEAVVRWCRQFEPHETAQGNLPGYVALCSTPQKQDGQAQDEVNASFAAERIAQIVAEVPGYSVGVLVRTNAMVGRLIYELRRRHIPASEEGGNPLTDSAAVQLILSLLHLADHPGDAVARYHLARSPWGAAWGLASHEEDQAAIRASHQVRRQLLDEGYGSALASWVRQLAPACNRRELSRALQLVEMAYEYQAHASLRTVDFVEFVRRQKVADPSAADVRVMTVHQAKGLEFEIVVLPELDEHLVGQPPPVVVGRDGPVGPIQRVCRYANADVQQLLPTEFQQMFSAATGRTVAESLCVLYVALTRAIHTLYMFVSPSASSSGKLPRTMAGLLRWSLVGDGPVDPEQLLFEHGDPRWQQKLPVRSATGSAVADAGVKPLAVRLAPTATSRARGLDRRAPSKLAASGTVDLSEILSPAANEAGMLFGTIIHACFEQVDWLDDGTPDRALLRPVVHRFCRHDADVEQRLDDFYALLARPAVARTLSQVAALDPRETGFLPALAAELAAGGVQVEARREYKFALRDADAIVTGSVDRLVLWRRGAEIIAAEILDFKTDAISPGDARALAERVEHHRPQLAAYRRAMARALRLDERRIAARLLFVTTGDVAVVEAGGP